MLAPVYIDIGGLYGLEQLLMQESDSELRGAEEHLRLLLQQVVRAGAFRLTSTSKHLLGCFTSLR